MDSSSIWRTANGVVLKNHRSARTLRFCRNAENVKSLILSISLTIYSKCNLLLAGSESEDNSDYTQMKPGSTPLIRSGAATSSKPGQFNFLVQLGKLSNIFSFSNNNFSRLSVITVDPTMNSNQKIGIIHKKIQDLRKTYNHLKAELASIDRRRKKLRRRDRETKKNLMKTQTVN